MTALSIYYVNRGFCLAADGNVTDRFDGVLQVTKSSAQKIFNLQGSNYNLACAMSGEVSSDDLTYDIVREINSYTGEYSSFLEWCSSLGKKIQESLAKAKRDGKLTPYKPSATPTERENIIVDVYLVGYFRGTPVWNDIVFWHGINGVEFQVCNMRLINGLLIAGGAVKAPRLAQDGDERLAKYRNHLNQRPENISSIDDAANFVTAYVEVCCDPYSKEIDEDCKCLGGHIHVAEITTNGFRWRIPPKEKPAISGG